MRSTPFTCSLKNNLNFMLGHGDVEMSLQGLSLVYWPQHSVMFLLFALWCHHKERERWLLLKSQISLKEIAIKFCVDSPGVRLKTNYLWVRKTDDLQWGCTNVRICVSGCSSPRKLFAFINVCVSRDLWTRHSQRKILLLLLDSVI